MNMTNIRSRGRVVAITLLLLIYHAHDDSKLTTPAAAQDALGRKAKPLHVAALRDVSTSMKEDGRHQAAGEALKLAATLLEGRFTIIDFSNHARAASFDLPAMHKQVFEAIDRTPIAGGTSYLAALREMPPEVSAAVFLSDGEPSENPEEIATFLKTVRCPIHTIAVNAAAEEVLRQMAASTGGGFYRASDARSLVDSFLAILSQVSSLRTKESSGPPVKLDSVTGKTLCIGINAQPTIQVEGRSMAFRPERNGEHVFRLPGANVHVATEVLDSPSNVSVTLGPPGSKGPAQLVVATTSNSKLDLKPARTESGKLVAQAQFLGGNLPTDSAPITSVFKVVGEDGQVKHAVAGKRVGDTLVARLTSPQVTSASRWKPWTPKTASG